MAWAIITAATPAATPAAIIAGRIICTAALGDITRGIVSPARLANMTGGIIGTTALADVTGGIICTAALARVTRCIVRAAALADVTGGIVGSATLAGIAGRIVTAAALADVTGRVVRPAAGVGGGTRQQLRGGEPGEQRNLERLAHRFSPCERRQRGTAPQQRLLQRIIPCGVIFSANSALGNKCIWLALCCWSLCAATLA